MAIGGFFSVPFADVMSRKALWTPEVPYLCFFGLAFTAGYMVFDLGMMYATGRSVAIDLVAAHKWFNLAAAKGKQAAKR